MPAYFGELDWDAFTHPRAHAGRWYRWHVLPRQTSEVLILTSVHSTQWAPEQVAATPVWRQHWS